MRIFCILLCLILFSVSAFAEEGSSSAVVDEVVLESSMPLGSSSPSSVSSSVPDSVSDSSSSNDTGSSVDSLTIEAHTVIIQQGSSSSEDTAPGLYAANNSSPLLGGYYIDCNTSQLGELRIYVPVSYVDGYLTYTQAGNLFNLSNSTVTCTAFNGSGTQYTVRFSAFSEPEYRLFSSGGSTNYQDLNVLSVTSSNIDILRENPPFPVSQTILMIISLFIMGVIAVCLFMRR